MDDIAKARNALKAAAEARERGAIEQFVARSIDDGAIVSEPEHDSLLTRLGLPNSRLEQTSDVFALPRTGDQMPLAGYLASALTGLDDEQRQYVFQLSDAVATKFESHGIKLYEPRKSTDPNVNLEIPDSEVFKLDRKKVLESDVLVFLAHYPSVGAGQELDFAYNAMIPIIVVSRTTQRVSRMVTGIPGLIVRIEYSEPEELRGRLDAEIDRLRPLLELRSVAFGVHDQNVVGTRIRETREALMMTRAEVAEAARAWGNITEKRLAEWETSSDREFNPSLIQLRELAFILKTSVAELVERDLMALQLKFIDALFDSHR